MAVICRGIATGVYRYIQGAPIKKQSPRKNSISTELYQIFFTRFMLFTEENLGHVSSKLHLNIWFDSKIITI